MSDDSKQYQFRFFQKLARHPIFPILVFVVASKALGEFYPFSPFSMYSNPTTRPLRYCYVADTTGQPIRILYHTGTSPASITKNYNRLLSKVGEGKAGAEVLMQLRERSETRPDRELTGGLQLVQVLIGFDESGAGLEEKATVVGELDPELER